MVVTHYTGALRTLFILLFLLPFSDFPFSSIRFCLLRRARFLRSQRNSHSLTFQQGHLLYFAYSSKSFAKRSNNTSPCSLKRMERPLKNTYAFTLSPSCKNPMACFNLKL